MNADIIISRSNRFAAVQPVTAKGADWLHRQQGDTRGPYGDSAVLPINVALGARDCGLTVAEV